MCVLTVISEVDSFQSFIENSDLPIYQSHEKGEENKTLNRKLGYYDNYGFSCHVSKRSWGDFEGQIEDIIFFVKNIKMNCTRSKTRLSDQRMVV